MSHTSTKHNTAFGSWTAVAVWFGIILLTIPFARSIQGWIDGVILGKALFASALILVVLFTLSLVRTFRKNLDHKVRRTAWLFALAAATAWIVLFRLQTTIEIVHFMEYGVLSALLFRAWVRVVRDEQVYLVSLLCVGVASFVDEFIQWMVPGRYWDFHDIVLNVIAGGIAQLFIARVFLTGKLSSKSTRRATRISCRLAWLNLLFFAFAFWNSPASVASYASRVPFLQFLIHNESVMVEYGYYHDDSGLGSFYSRMTMDELDLIDNERGEEAGQIVARSLSTMDYMDFLKIYTSSRDPFVHEFRVHLYRRNHYYAAAWKHKESDPDRYVYHMTVALRENQILEEYFPVALSASDQQLSAEALKEIGSLADWAYSYTSPVSSHLIVNWTALKCQMVFLVLAGGVGMIYLRYGKD